MPAQVKTRRRPPRRPDDAPRQARVLEAINRIFGEALSAKTEERLGEVCLAAAEEVTGSRFGFMGEMNAAGQLDDVAISDPGWKVCRVPKPAGGHIIPGGFKIHGIYGRVIRDGRSLLTNGPAKHPDRIGLPEGHPPLTAFLGVPLFREGRLIGMIAVGNRPGGYGPEQQEDLERLAPAIVQAFISKRAELALNESEERFSKAFHGNPVPLTIIRVSDECYVDVNRAYLSLVGYNREEVLDHSPTELGLYPDQAARNELAAAAVRRGGIHEREMDLRTKDARLLRVILSLQTVRMKGEKHVLATFLDITERKRTETALMAAKAELENTSEELRAQNDELLAIQAELQESEERYRAIYEHSKDAIFVADPSQQGRILSANPAAARLMGWTREELVGTFRDHVLDLGDPGLAAMLREREASGAAEARITYKRKDGTTFRGEVSSALFRDHNGETRAVTIIRDVTERERAEEAVRLSEQKFAAAFENNPAAVALTRLLDGVYLDVNRTFETMLGYGRDEVLGRSARTLGVWPDADAARRFVRELREKGSLRGWEQVFRKKSGETLISELSAQVLTIQGDALILSTLIDITDRKRAEEDLREANVVLDTVVEHTDAHLAYMDPSFNFVWVNRAYARAARHDVAFFPGQNHFALYPNAENESLFRRVVETKEPLIITDRAFEYPDQPERGTTWWNWSLYPVIEDGRVCGLVLSLVDTTEYHRIQRRIEQLRAEREAFLRHEVRNLLTPLELYIGMLRLDASLSAEHRRNLETMERSLRRTNAFIAQLKTITDLELGNYTLALAPGELAAVIGQALDEVRPSADSAGVALRFEDRTPGAAIPLDRNFLTGVFVNLVRNAVEHVERSTDPAQKTVTVGLDREDGRYVVRVRNRGAPIPPERITTFFEKFNVGPEKPGGTGLGTTYAYLVTRAHGGNISVASNAEDGTTVTVSFPAKT